MNRNIQIPSIETLNLQLRNKTSLIFNNTNIHGTLVSGEACESPEYYNLYFLLRIYLPQNIHMVMMTFILWFLLSFSVATECLPSV